MPPQDDKAANKPDTELSVNERLERDGPLIYRAIGESIDYGIWICDADARNVYASESLLKLVGITRDQCADFGWGDVLHPDDSKDTIAAWQECVRTGGFWERVHRYLGKDGKYHPILARGVPVRDETGKITWWAGINLDIGQLKETEDALRKSEARFRHLADFVPQVIWETDPSGSVTYVNRRWYEATGLTPEQTLGEGWKTVLHAEDAPRLLAAWQASLKSRTFLEVEARYRCADGVYRWMLVRAAPVSNADGSVAGWIGSSTDIEDRIRAEETLRRAKEEAESAARAKSAFLANMSHDIRTPLTSILGFAEVIQEHAQEDVKEWARLICEGGRKLMDTLNSVLDLARLEGRQIQLKPIPVDLDKQAEESVALFRNEAANRGLAIRAVHEQGREEPVVALADAAALSRVLFNLIGNALKFTHSGSIEILVCQAGEEAEISVKDTGIGISEAFMPHLFEPFRQESTGETRAVPGTGLGLAITRQLVELMGGSIRVSSLRGKGSCFTVRLPQAPTGAGKEGVQDNAGTSEKRTSRRPVILLVEDNANTAKVVEIFLRRDYQVEVADTLELALSKARMVPLDAVLMDININSRYTGVDLLCMLRELPGCEKLPAVAFTAYALPGERERFLQLGFDDYQGKPFTRQDLLATVARVLGRRPVESVTEPAPGS